MEVKTIDKKCGSSIGIEVFGKFPEFKKKKSVQELKEEMRKGWAMKFRKKHKKKNLT